MTLYLVPAGRNRFELYSEIQEDAPPPAHGARVFRRFANWALVRWHAVVDAARHGSAGGRFARWRDGIVCHLADSIAEQRTLWALRRATAATARFPTTLDASRAEATVKHALARGRRHHLLWFVVDLVGFVVSGLIALVPGPNVIAYYFGFRTLGHFWSWRGACQGMDRVAWTFDACPDLAELSALVDLPRQTRAPRVEAIAAQLNLSRLSAFFDRVAAPSA
jgi:hypothetical protein